MPDMNGIEVTRQIRRLGDDTPIIILTAYDWSDIEEEARNAGVTAFCSKPMFMSDLRDTLLKAIGSEECQNESALPVADEESNFQGKHLLLRLEMLWNTIANYFDQFRFIWPLKKASLWRSLFLLFR